MTTSISMILIYDLVISQDMTKSNFNDFYFITFSYSQGCVVRWCSGRKCLARNYGTTLEVLRFPFFADFFSFMVSSAMLHLLDLRGDNGPSLLMLGELTRGKGGQSLEMFRELLLFFSLEESGFSDEDFLVGVFLVEDDFLNGEVGGVKRASEASTSNADIDLIFRGSAVLDFLGLLLDFFFFFFLSSSGTNTTKPSPTSFAFLLLFFFFLSLEDDFLDFDFLRGTGAGSTVIISGGMEMARLSFMPAAWSMHSSKDGVAASGAVS
jgi:hypothetical protein